MAEKKKKGEEKRENLQAEGYKVTEVPYCEMVARGTVKDGTHTPEEVNIAKEKHEEQRMLQIQYGSKKGKERAEKNKLLGRCFVTHAKDDDFEDLMLEMMFMPSALDFLKCRWNIVKRALKFVRCPSVLSFLLKLICNVEEDEIRQSVHQRLNKCQLVERLVDKLSQDANPEDHANADRLLCEISTSCRDTSSDGHQQTNPLLATLESEDTVNKLLDLLLHEDRNDSSLSHVINILLTLMSAGTQQQQIQHQQQQQQGLQQSASVDSSDSESSDWRKNAVARIIAKRLPSLQNILMDPPKGLPGDKATQWEDFVSNALAELNRKNEIAPLPGFKEMDMDVIGDFRYADDEFKDPDDNLSGPLQALALSGASGLGSGAPAAGQAVDGGGEAKNFLSSRGLMKTSGENAGISEAGTTPPIPSENDEETSRPPSPPKGETLPESTAQN